MSKTRQQRTVAKLTAHIANLKEQIAIRDKAASRAFLETQLTAARTSLLEAQMEIKKLREDNKALKVGV